MQLKAELSGTENRTENTDKIYLFLENARLLSEEFGIIPLLYGSLGLEYLTGENLDADDIDILIPKAFLTDNWVDFKNILESNGYILADEHEHTFIKDGVSYSYADIEELESFAGIFDIDIEVLENNSVKFKLLSLEQYLKVYRASAKDGYRVNVREKKDKEKITFIEEYLRNNIKY
ncbi:MAG: hypothetical protein IJN27_08355 [Oscillospiraceae bacterium]|nr:hypothetical protein [Oscillospiraceae bacterium]